MLASFREELLQQNSDLTGNNDPIKKILHISYGR